MMRRALIVAAVACIPGLAAAQSTAFTYQGELKNAGNPASGPHDIRFKLFDAASGGAQIGSTVCVDNVQVTGGRFTATIDFGQQFANVSARHLEVEVRADSGLDCSNTGGYTTLSPRQSITPAPRAAAANTAFSLSSPDGSPQSSLLVDNEGRVGIGTSTPQVALHVRALQTGPTPGEGLRIQGTLSTPANQAYATFHNAAGALIGYVGDGGSANNVELSSQVGDVRIFTAAGPVLNTTAGGDVGIGTTTPAATLDVRGDVKLGSSGQLFASAGAENLRIVRGLVQADGTIAQGTGFTVSHPATGDYIITFSPAFASAPTVTASTGNNERTNTASWSSIFAGTATIRVNCPSLGSGGCNRDFSFIAIGPR